MMFLSAPLRLCFSASFQRLLSGALLLTCVMGAQALWAQELVIRKTLRERIPDLPRIESISKTPINGLYEVLLEDNDIYYTDASGNSLLQGSMIDTRSKRNLTEERSDKLNAIAFGSLPLKDAITIVRGNGQRKLAVFADPNCGYCKRFERDLQKVDNITVYLFLYPILGADSSEKSRHVWCAKDPGKTWLDMMTRDIAPASASCDTAALTRNLEFGRKHKITGTPTLLAQDGKRVPGAIPLAQIEQLISVR